MSKLGKSALYYRKNKAARDAKAKYDTAYESTPERIKYRSRLSVERKKRHLVGSPLDLSHTKSGKLVLENRKRNRQRNGHGDNGRLK